jgi:hypothetical protein
MRGPKKGGSATRCVVGGLASAFSTVGSNGFIEAVSSLMAGFEF